MSQRILWLATKPPWPSVDGGRLLMAQTIEALAREGHHIHVLAPRLRDTQEPPESVRDRIVLETVSSSLLPGPAAAFLALLSGRPTSAVRHRHPAIERRAGQLLSSKPFDAIHVEQVQALGGLPKNTDVPVVLRAQNVESSLWQQAARYEKGLMRAWLSREARALAAFETRGLARVDLTLALTTCDQTALKKLAPKARVELLRAPFPGQLEAASLGLEGEPPLVIIGDGRWRPNRDGLEHFLSQTWPEVLGHNRAARLHLYAGKDFRSAADGVLCHGELDDSRQAFAPHSTLMVPLRIASGVRMKILEAWARGIPVVASSAAAAGLDATSGEHLFVADDAAAVNHAIERLGQPALRQQMVDQARAFLAQHHDPEVLAAELLHYYEQARAAQGFAEHPPTPALR